MDTRQVIIPKAPEQVTDLPVGDSVSSITEANVRSLQGYFGVEDASDSDMNMLSEIYRIVAGDGHTDMAGVLSYLHRIKGDLGPTPLGVSRLHHVYNYLKISYDIHNLEEKRRSLLG